MNFFRYYGELKHIFFETEKRLKIDFDKGCCFIFY